MRRRLRITDRQQKKKSRPFHFQHECEISFSDSLWADDVWGYGKTWFCQFIYYQWLGVEYHYRFWKAKMYETEASCRIPSGEFLMSDILGQDLGLYLLHLGKVNALLWWLSRTIVSSLLRFLLDFTNLLWQLVLALWKSLCCLWWCFELVGFICHRIFYFKLLYYRALQS